MDRNVDSANESTRAAPRETGDRLLLGRLSEYETGSEVNVPRVKADPVGCPSNDVCRCHVYDCSGQSHTCQVFVEIYLEVTARRSCQDSIRPNIFVTAHCETVWRSTFLSKKVPAFSGHHSASCSV